MPVYTEEKKVTERESTKSGILYIYIYIMGRHHHSEILISSSIFLLFFFRERNSEIVQEREKG